MTELCY